MTVAEGVGAADTSASAALPDAAVSLDRVSKRFGDVLAVSDVSLDIRDGEFFSLLGPSGSGKSTTLRLIAGFERPTSGRVLLRGRDVSGLPPYERDVNTVFQDYALFPHMSVEDNVAYSLRIRRVAPKERARRVEEALHRVRLDDFQRRSPAQLSGGQRQRVALARALINRPRVLLLDEPLGALDRKLREQMQVELKEIQQSVGITFVFVTHDQEEALAMSDRLAVFDAGRVEQVGTPADVYEQPRTAFVAGFVGSSNVIEGALAQRLLGATGRFTIRPERVRLGRPGAPHAADEVSVAGTLREVVYLGAQTRHVVSLDDGSDFVVTEPSLGSASDAIARRGNHVVLVWRRQHTLPLADRVPAPDQEENQP